MSEFMKKLALQHGLDYDAISPDFFGRRQPGSKRFAPMIEKALRKVGLDPDTVEMIMHNPPYGSGQAVQVFTSTGKFELPKQLSANAKAFLGGKEVVVKEEGGIVFVNPKPELHGRTADRIIEDDLGFGNTPRQADTNPDLTEAWS